MTYMDALDQELNEGIRHAIRRGAFRAGQKEAVDAVIALAREEFGSRPDEILIGAPAADFLKRAIDRVTARLTASIAGGFEPYRWLWYLRRLDGDLFEGGLSTTEPYDRSLAETLVICGQEDRLPRVPVSKEGLFPFDSAVAGRIASICGRTKMISQLHRDFRVVGKGGSVRIGRNRAPLVETDDDTWRAIEDYDARHEKGPDLLLSGIGPTIGPGKSERGTLPLFLMGAPSKPTIAQIPVGEWDGMSSMSLGSSTMPVMVRHSPMVFEAAKLYAAMALPALADPGIWHPELGPLLALSFLLSSLFLRSPQNRANLMRTGYVLVGRDTCREFFDELLPEIRETFEKARLPVVDRVPSIGSQLLADLSAMRGAAWPLLPGPVVFRASPDLIGIDAWAASQRLRKRLVFPRETGEVGNARSRVFELSMQDSVNTSPWRPRDEYLVLRGKTLRRSGQPIGDIDAIAEKDGTILLISCKSYSYDLAYDTGEFSATRRLYSRIQVDLDEWDRFVQEIRTTPTGDNFSFHECRHIEGVLVTPYLYYLPPPRSFRESAAGLRSYSSAGELEAWMADQERTLV